jgi:hypothetical protein
MNSSESAGNACEFDHLRGGGKCSGHIEEPGTETKRPVLHALFDKRAHFVQFIAGCLTVDFADDR